RFDIAEGIVEVSEQVLPPLHIGDRQGVSQRNSAHTEWPSGPRRGARGKRTIFDAQKTSPVWRLRRCDPSRQVGWRRKLLAHHGAVAGKLQRRQRAVTCVEVVPAKFVGCERVADAAQNGELIGM